MPASFALAHRIESMRGLFASVVFQ